MSHPNGNHHNKGSKESRPSSTGGGAASPSTGGGSGRKQIEKRVCRDGDDCQKWEECKFIHSGAWRKKMRDSAASRGVVMKPRVFPPKPCNHGDDCENRKCWFEHSPEWKLKMAQGRNPNAEHFPAIPGSAQNPRKTVLESLAVNFEKIKAGSKPKQDTSVSFTKFIEMSPEIMKSFLGMFPPFVEDCNALGKIEKLITETFVSICDFEGFISNAKRSVENYEATKFLSFLATQNDSEDSEMLLQDFLDFFFKFTGGVRLNLTEIKPLLEDPDFVGSLKAFLEDLESYICRVQTFFETIVKPDYDAFVSASSSGSKTATMYSIMEALTALQRLRNELPTNEQSQINQTINCLTAIRGMKPSPSMWLSSNVVKGFVESAQSFVDLFLQEQQTAEQIRIGEAKMNCVNVKAALLRSRSDMTILLKAVSFAIALLTNNKSSCYQSWLKSLNEDDQAIVNKDQNGLLDKLINSIYALLTKLNDEGEIFTTSMLAEQVDHRFEGIVKQLFERALTHLKEDISFSFEKVIDVLTKFVDDRGQIQDVIDLMYSDFNAKNFKSDVNENFIRFSKLLDYLHKVMIDFFGDNLKFRMDSSSVTVTLSEPKSEQGVSKVTLSEPKSEQGVSKSTDVSEIVSKFFLTYLSYTKVLLERGVCPTFGNRGHVCSFITVLNDVGSKLFGRFRPFKKQQSKDDNGMGTPVFSSLEIRKEIGAKTSKDFHELSHLDILKFFMDASLDALLERKIQNKCDKDAVKAEAIKRVEAIFGSKPKGVQELISRFVLLACKDPINKIVSSFTDIICCKKNSHQFQKLVEVLLDNPEKASKTGMFVSIRDAFAFASMTQTNHEERTKQCFQSLHNLFNFVIAAGVDLGEISFVGKQLAHLQKMKVKPFYLQQFWLAVLIALVKTFNMSYQDAYTKLQSAMKCSGFKTVEQYAIDSKSLEIMFSSVNNTFTFSGALRFLTQKSEQGERIDPMLLRFLQEADCRSPNPISKTEDFDLEQLSSDLTKVMIVLHVQDDRFRTESSSGSVIDSLSACLVSCLSSSRSQLFELFGVDFKSDSEVPKKATCSPAERAMSSFNEGYMLSLLAPSLASFTIASFFTLLKKWEATRIELQSGFELTADEVKGTKIDLKNQLRIEITLKIFQYLGFLQASQVEHCKEQNFKVPQCIEFVSSLKKSLLTTDFLTDLSEMIREYVFPSRESTKVSSCLYNEFKALRAQIISEREGNGERSQNESLYSALFFDTPAVEHEEQIEAPLEDSDVYLKLLGDDLRVQLDSVPLTVINFEQIANAMGRLLCSDPKTWSRSFHSLKRKFPEFFSDEFFQAIGVEEFDVNDDKGPTKFNSDLLALIKSFKTAVLGLGFTSSPTIDSYIKIYGLDEALMSNDTFLKYVQAAQNEFDYDLATWYEQHKIPISDMEHVD
jgi:hypothetical protein